MISGMAVVRKIDSLVLGDFAAAQNAFQMFVRP